MTMFRRGSYGHAKAVQAAAVFIFLGLLLLMYRTRSPPNPYAYTDGQPPRPVPQEQIPKGPSHEAAYLKMLGHKYGLTKDVPWFARRMRPSRSAASASSATDMKMAFMPSDFQRARWDDESLRLQSESAVKVPVTKSPTPDMTEASALMFGISTTYSRIKYANYSLVYDWSRWLTDGKGKSNGATLILTMHQSESREVADVSARLEQAGVDAVVRAADDDLDMTSRYIELVRTLAQKNTALSKENKQKRFLALVDDDVFFPTLSQLLSKLSKYNHGGEVYIGAPSERSDWIVEKNAIITYGGGAVFLSQAAADTISQLPCLADAKLDDPSQYPAQWDVLLHECILRHTSLDMQVLPSFYSPRDDVYGIQAASYEAGISPLTLHHYRNRHRFEPGKAHFVTAVCGEECFLQRLKFKDDWIMVNGFSITQYPDGVDIVPMDMAANIKTEHYREEKKLEVGDRLEVNDAHMDSKARKIVTWTGRKRTWRFLDSTVGPNGEVWQAYIKRGSTSSAGDFDDRQPGDIVHTNEEPSDVDSIIVIIWEP